MKNKKLSHNGLQGSVTSVMAALLCILIGLFVGFLVLLAINPAHAWADGFVRILKGGFHDAPYGVGKELANAAPLIMTGLSVGFAFKTGLFNIGAAGQYTLGAYGALYCAIMLKLPWFVCLLAAAILGGLWGAIPVSSRPTSTSTRSLPPLCSTGSACTLSMSWSTRTAPAPCMMCATPAP